MKSNGFVLALEVHASIQEENGVSEGSIVLLVEHINQISKEETVSDFDKPALIVDDFIDVVSKYALNRPEYVGICLF